MIRWITDNLGTAAWDAVAPTPDTYILDVRDLVDREGNSPVLVESKIAEGLKKLQEGFKVLVCCDYGMSRSNAIATGILARHESIGFAQALSRVTAATGEKAIKIAVLSAIRETLEEQKPAGAATEPLRRRLLVTGASGFIGSSLLGGLRMKYDVSSPTRAEIDLQRDTIALDQWVRDKKVDTVLHLANPHVYSTNEAVGASLVMFKNILDVCAENRLFLVCFSSWEIFSGYKTKELQADEALPPLPGNSYGQSKVLCEELLRLNHRRFGIEYTLLRSSPVYGPSGDRPKFIWNFLQKALRNEDIVAHRYANGLPCLDLLHVDDLCGAVLAALERRLQGVFNLGTGVGTSTTDIAQRIVERTGSRSLIRHHEIAGYAGNIVMDPSRAASLLGWRPETSLWAGLESIINIGKAQELSRKAGPEASRVHGVGSASASD